MTECSIEGCTNPAAKRGFCRKHYQRWLRHGAPEIIKPHVTPNAGKTHCKHGHAFTEANTYRTKTGKRMCRACNRRTSIEYLRRRRQQAT